MYANPARERFRNDGIGSTPPPRLLVMLYDRLLRDLDHARAGLARSDIPQTHDALTHAQDIVAELLGALDPARWDGADRMAQLYAWLADVLARANVAKSDELVAEARSVVQPLRDAWFEAYVETSVARPAAAMAAAPGSALDATG